MNSFSYFEVKVRVACSKMMAWSSSSQLDAARVLSRPLRSGVTEFE
jgi:hypothetical protein